MSKVTTDDIADVLREVHGGWEADSVSWLLRIIDGMVEDALVDDELTHCKSSQIKKVRDFFKEALE